MRRWPATTAVTGLTLASILVGGPGEGVRFAWHHVRSTSTVPVAKKNGDGTGGRCNRVSR